MKSQQIRKKFLDFFENKGHTIVNSSPIVIKNDPTLMFTNAGMNQFKDLFLGVREAKNPRVANSQKCLRVSGKHNDLEEVGHDTYHHTMFEMLGNWSFGNYFKKEAIDWSWELLTKEYGINPDRLYVTIFEGSPKDRLSKDIQSFNCWKVHIVEDRIIEGNRKDNFWEMGEVGPCGPCSEIHIDLRTDKERSMIDGTELVNQDHPQVIELWNLVFMQYNRLSSGVLEVLPNKHVDTGMGFERLAMALQSKKSNYETDIFTPLIGKLSFISGVTYGKDEKVDIALRVISDHVRAITFAISDGQLPSNTGAGYVIRRILRRAVRYGFTFLNFKSPFIYRLVSVLVNQMADFYPQIKKQQSLIENVIKEEENSFMHTLENGLSRIEDLVKSSSSDIIDGVKAFELYDTFGFPIDLTELILSERGMSVDMNGYALEMTKQKERARFASHTETGDWVKLSSNDTKFIGYDSLSSNIKISQYRKVIQKKESFFQLVFNQTPFYPEGGGQVGDQGYISSSSEFIPIYDTKKENNLIVHFAKKLPKDLKKDFVAQVKSERRRQIEKNHSATHLLHEALRNILGPHVEQKGSLVSDQHFRFDFSHFSKMSDLEIQNVEDKINEKIQQNFPLVETRAVSMIKAKEMGAMMLFGEKYGDQVRVIKFGTSLELCGGCHVTNTSQIGFVKIKSESGVAAGIRRIEAISSEQAFEFFRNEEETLKQVRFLLKNVNDPLKSLKRLIHEKDVLIKKLAKFSAEKINSLKNDLIESCKEVGNINFICAQLDIEPSEMKNISFDCKSEMEKLIIILAVIQGKKAFLSIGISKDLVEKKSLNAGQIIREIAKEINGSGGGQAFYATAGGTNTEGIKSALRKMEIYCKNLN